MEKLKAIVKNEAYPQGEVMDVQGAALFSPIGRALIHKFGLDCRDGIKTYNTTISCKIPQWEDEEDWIKNIEFIEYLGLDDCEGQGVYEYDVYEYYRDKNDSFQKRKLQIAGYHLATKNFTMPYIGLLSINLVWKRISSDR